MRPRARFIALLTALLLALVLASCAPLARPTETPSPTATPIPPTYTPTPTDTPVPPTNTPTPPPSASPDSAEDTRPPTPNVEGAAVYSYRVVNAYPHDRNAFTQGLVYLDGIFYEGTGLRGLSSLRKVDPETGQVLQFLALPAQFFGEGVAVMADRIYQLTWQSRAGFVYDKESFELLQTFTYPTEGWGLTHDGDQLIMSDGTATLHFLDPMTLEEISQVQVHDDHGPVVWLNELEVVQEEIYANVWQTDLVARIDPDSGRVTGWIDLSGILEPQDPGIPVDVLNGIAYDAETDRLFVTGKLWPRLFEIELIPGAAQPSPTETGSP